jgi:hypothetical protein
MSTSMSDPKTPCVICKETTRRVPELMIASEYYCVDCYRKKTGRFPFQTPASANTSKISHLEQRYGATRLMVAVFRIAALLAVVGAVIFAVQASAELAFGPDVLALLVAAFAGGLIMLALAEGLQVVLDMEEHQRAIRLRIEGYIDRQGAKT